jgi:hypothetical protein
VCVRPCSPPTAARSQLRRAGVAEGRSHSTSHHIQRGCVRHTDRCKTRASVIINAAEEFREGASLIFGDDEHHVIVIAGLARWMGVSRIISSHGEQSFCSLWLGPEVRLLPLPPVRFIPTYSRNSCRRCRGADCAALCAGAISRQSRPRTTAPKSADHGKPARSQWPAVAAR